MKILKYYKRIEYQLIMMIKDIYYKFSLSQLKIGQLYSMKSFKEIITMDLELVTSKVYSNVQSQNKKKEVYFLWNIKKYLFLYLIKNFIYKLNKKCYIL